MKWLLGSFDKTRTGWFLALFGLYAGRALFKNGFMMLEFRDTLDVAMSVVKVVVAGVAKTLVPEKTFSGSANRIDRGGVLYDTMEWKGMVTLRHGMELILKISVLVFLVGIDVLDGSTLTSRMEVGVSS